MSILNSLKQQKQEMSQAQAGENVAVIVENYGNENGVDFVAGTRVDNNEPIKIGLFEDKDAGSRKYPRPEVVDFANKKHKTHTQPGGVILFEGTYKTRDLTKARWATSLAHVAEESEIMIAPARVGPIKEGAKGVYVDVLRPMLAEQVTSSQEADAAIVAALDPIDGNSPFVVVRLAEGDEVFTQVISADRSKPTKEGEYPVTLSGRESLDKFLGTDLGRSIMKAVASAGVTAEVIPGERIFFGPASVAAIIEKGKSPDKPYSVSEGVTGFTESVIAIRRHEGGGAYATRALPTSTKPKLFTLEQLPTSVIQPTIQQPVISQDEEEANDPHTGDDMVAAAANEAIREAEEKVGSAGRRYAQGR